MLVLKIDTIPKPDGLGETDPVEFVVQKANDLGWRSGGVRFQFEVFLIGVAKKRLWLRLGVIGDFWSEPANKELLNQILDRPAREPCERVLECQRQAMVITRRVVEI